jgi:hypothetical protein
MKLLGQSEFPSQFTLAVPKAGRLQNRPFLLSTVHLFWHFYAQLIQLYALLDED